MVLILSPDDLRFLAACKEGVLSSTVATSEHLISRRRVRVFWRRGIIDGHPYADQGRAWNTLRYTLTDRGRQVLAQHHS
jgi:hypothetical protein